MLEGLLRGTDIVVVSDEVYEHIVFDGHAHQSVARFPGLAERSFVVSSFGKTYHVTGWKMGYVLAPRELMTEFRKVHQFNVFVANGPLQYALAEYMKDKDAYLGARRVLPAQARLLPRRRCEGSRFKPLPSRGTFFQNLRYDAISDERDTDLAVRLTREHGVASIPVSVFYREPPRAQGAAVLLREIGSDARQRRRRSCGVSRRGRRSCGGRHGLPTSDGATASKPLAPDPVGQRAACSRMCERAGGAQPTRSRPR